MSPPQRPLSTPPSRPAWSASRPTDSWEINAGRRQVYAQAAAKNGVTVEVAGASAFKSVVQDRLKAGEYYQNAVGVWTQK